jgi:hypothetical protein
MRLFYFVRFFACLGLLTAVYCELNPTAVAASFASESEPFPVLHVLTPISPQQAQTIFEKFLADPQLPFKVPENGCEARAHYMARELERAGIIAGKVFLTGGLYVTSDYVCSVSWTHHVAPLVRVKTTKMDELWVIDPSIAKKPLELKKWIKIQTPLREANVTYTTRFIYSPKELDLYKQGWDAVDMETMRIILNENGKKQIERLRRAPPYGYECFS